MGTVDLANREGTVSGYLAIPRNGSGPGVLVLHAWWGLNDFAKGVCDRLAAAGFVAFAPDLYHGATASTRDEAEKLMSSLGQEAASRDIRNGSRGLQDHPNVRGDRLGVIGFSMGAYWSLWLAQELPRDFSAIVLFYGTAGTPEIGYAKTEAAFLGHFAEKDEFEPTAIVQDLEKLLRTNGKDVTFHTYPGTGHWFFEKDRTDAYDPRAADLAWQRTLQFLTTHLSGNTD